MSKDEVLKIRLTSEDLERLRLYAERKDVSMAQVLREYIKRLPKPES